MPKRKTEEEESDEAEEEEWKEKDVKDGDEDEDEDDDDDEEEDVKAKAKIKSKSPKKISKKVAKNPAKVSKKAAISEEEDEKIELGGKKFVSVRQFKNMTLVDIREFYEDRASGELKPGKKGISLQAAQWEALKEKMEEISALVEDLEG